VQDEEDLDHGLELFEGAQAEVVADLQLGVQELDEFLRVVLLVQDLLPQEGLLLLHVVHDHQL
jgi:hypothetical protein